MNIEPNNNNKKEGESKPSGGAALAAAKPPPQGTVLVDGKPSPAGALATKEVGKVDGVPESEPPQGGNNNNNKSPDAAAMFSKPPPQGTAAAGDASPAVTGTTSVPPKEPPINGDPSQLKSLAVGESKEKAPPNADNAGGKDSVSFVDSNTDSGSKPKDPPSTPAYSRISVTMPRTDGKEWPSNPVSLSIRKKKPSTISIGLRDPTVALSIPFNKPSQHSQLDLVSLYKGMYIHRVGDSDPMAASSLNLPAEEQGSITLPSTGSTDEEAFRAAQDKVASLESPSSLQQALVKSEPVTFILKSKKGRAWSDGNVLTILLGNVDTFVVEDFCVSEDTVESIVSKTPMKGKGQAKAGAGTPDSGVYSNETEATSPEVVYVRKQHAANLKMDSNRVRDALKSLQSVLQKVVCINEEAEGELAKLAKKYEQVQPDSSSDGARATNKKAKDQALAIAMEWARDHDRTTKEELALFDADTQREIYLAQLVIDEVVASLRKTLMMREDLRDKLLDERQKAAEKGFQQHKNTFQDIDDQLAAKMNSKRTDIISYKNCINSKRKKALRKVEHDVTSKISDLQKQFGEAKVWIDGTKPNFDAAAANQSELAIIATANFFLDILEGKAIPLDLNPSAPEDGLDVLAGKEAEVDVNTAETEEVTEATGLLTNPYGSLSLPAEDGKENAATPTEKDSVEVCSSEVTTKAGLCDPSASTTDTPASRTASPSETAEVGATKEPLKDTTSPSSFAEKLVQSPVTATTNKTTESSTPTTSTLKATSTSTENESTPTSSNSDSFTTPKKISGSESINQLFDASPGVRSISSFGGFGGGDDDDDDSLDLENRDHTRQLNRSLSSPSLSVSEASQQRASHSTSAPTSDEMAPNNLGTSPLWHGPGMLRTAGTLRGFDNVVLDLSVGNDKERLEKVAAVARRKGLAGWDETPTKLSQLEGMKSSDLVLVLDWLNDGGLSRNNNYKQRCADLENNERSRPIFRMALASPAWLKENLSKAKLSFEEMQLEGGPATVVCDDIQVDGSSYTDDYLQLRVALLLCIDVDVDDVSELFDICNKYAAHKELSDLKSKKSWEDIRAAVVLGCCYLWECPGFHHKTKLHNVIQLLGLSLKHTPKILKALKDGGLNQNKLFKDHIMEMENSQDGKKRLRCRQFLAGPAWFSNNHMKPPLTYDFLKKNKSGGPASIVSSRGFNTKAYLNVRVGMLLKLQCDFSPSKLDEIFDDCQKSHAAAKAEKKARNLSSTNPSTDDESEASVSDF